MTMIQLHAGKLWFVAKVTHWELADCELDELKETMETAKALNPERMQRMSNRGGLQIFHIAHPGAPAVTNRRWKTPAKK